MRANSRLSACLLALSLLLGSLPLGAASARPLPIPVQASAQTSSTAQTPVEDNEPFKFGKVDLELLAQINQLDQRFEKEGFVYHEAAFEAYLSRVGKAVVADKELENVTWKFRALRDPEPNAFALPNGSIYVHTGLLGLLDDEAQLAGVLAHEVNHVTKRHTYKMNRSIRKKVLAINILNTIGSWNPFGGAAGAAIDLVASISPFMLVLSVFGYSRELEKEADLEGLKNVSAAGYAPDGIVNAFKLMQKDLEGEQLNTFWSDHPKLQERINYISKSIPDSAKKLTDEQLREARNDYLKQTETVDRHDIELAINSGRFHTAYYISKKLVDFNPSTENVFYLAEAYRALGPRAPELTAAELTGGAKKKAAKNRRKRTLEEMEAELLKTPAGQQAWASNQKKAEELYLRALELNRFNYVAHRGLGMLYEKLGRKDEAIAGYSKYLELAPNAFDSERIRRRLHAMKGIL